MNQPVDKGLQVASDKDIAEAKAAGYAVQQGNASHGPVLNGRWWWTLSQPGWMEVETSRGDFESERAAWRDAVGALRSDTELAQGLRQGRTALSETEAALVQAIEASGYSVCGPTDSRAAEHGEPAWVCNARGVLARARAARVPIAPVPSDSQEVASDRKAAPILWVALVEHQSQPGTRPVLFAQPDEPTDNTILSRFRSDADESELEVAGLFDLSHVVSTDPVSKEALETYARQMEW